jgi:hypothetical protein
MKVTTKMNQHALGTLMKAQRQALEMTGQQVLNDLRDSQTMPFDTGNMQNDQTFMDDSKSDKGTVSVVTDTPYARRLYFHPEYDFQKGKNPNAGAGWFDPYIDGEKTHKIKQWFKQFVKRNGGGYVK